MAKFRARVFLWGKALQPEWAKPENFKKNMHPIFRKGSYQENPRVGRYVGLVSALQEWVDTFIGEDVGEGTLVEITNYWSERIR